MYKFYILLQRPHIVKSTSNILLLKGICDIVCTFEITCQNKPFSPCKWVKNIISINEKVDDALAELGRGK